MTDDDVDRARGWARRWSIQVTLGNEKDAKTVSVPRLAEAHVAVPEHPVKSPEVTVRKDRGATDRRGHHAGVAVFAQW